MDQRQENAGVVSNLFITGIFLLIALVAPLKSAEAASDTDQLIGTWKLISWKHRQADGSTRYPMGETPVGQLIYDKLGNISVQIMDDFRPTFESGFEQTSLEELKSVYQTYAALFGSYSVDTTNKIIGIQVQAITNPNYLSSNLTRYYNLKGDKLTLSFDKKHMNNTVWQRLK